MLNRIQMVPIEWLAHHPENPRLDLGDVTELADSIRANGVLQNLTVVPATDDEDSEYKRFWVVIGNRRLEAAKLAGLKELPCVLSDMPREEQIATMLQENMQRSDLTVYEQAKGIQMMMNLGFTKEQVQERTGFSRATIERRLAVASLPEEKTKDAVTRGYDLLDLVEISKIEDKKTREKLLSSNCVIEGTNNVDRSQLRHLITMAQRDELRKKQTDRLLPEVEKFAKPLPEKEASRIYSSSWNHLPSLDVKLEPDAKVKPPKDPGKYYYRVIWNCIEIWEKVKQVKAEKSEAQIEREQRAHDAKELNARMRENRVAFVSGYTPTKTQENALRAKLTDYVFGWTNQYQPGDFSTSYHSWNIGCFRALCGMPAEEGRGQESLAEELKRRSIPPGRAFLAWMLCGGVWADDRRGYASEYDGSYSPHRDMDRVYEILTDAGYILSEEEQAWKDGTHEFYRRG